MEYTHLSEQEIADELSRSEGCQITADEVRIITAQAMRKLGTLLRKRGVTAENILPDDEVRARRVVGQGWG